MNKSAWLGIIAIAFTGLGSQAETQYKKNPIRLNTPDVYKFGIFRVSESATDCSNLNRLVKVYADNKCETPNGTLSCRSIAAQIQVELNLDRQNPNSMESFARLYSITSSEEVQIPESYSKRFDQAYVDAYDFSLRSLETAQAFRFDGEMREAELHIESKLRSDSGYTVVYVNDQRYLKLTSKIRVCALESGRLSLVGKANVNVHTYHPVGKVAYEIAGDVLGEAQKIADKRDFSVAQKNYLLGMAAGRALQKMKTLINDPEELEEIAVSLQNVVLTGDSSDFIPASVSGSSNIGVQLLDHDYSFANSSIKIEYRARSL